MEGCRSRGGEVIVYLLFMHQFSIRKYDINTIYMNCIFQKLFFVDFMYS